MSQTMAKRPRVWVPGVAWVSEERELVVGPHVGFNGHGKAFAQSRCAHFTRLEELRHTLWLVERRALSDGVIDEHAIILAERLLDPDAQPHARRWLAEQPLVCVSGMKVGRLVAAGLRVYTVSYGVDDEGVLSLSGEGGRRAPWSLHGRLIDMLPADLRPEAPGSLRSEAREVRTFVDRLLARLSRGALREVSVLNAWAARSLVEPGYGYHGATDGVPSTVERVHRDVRALDALFAQIYARAEEMRDDAHEMQRAVSGAPPDADKLRLPIYDGARREDLLELPVVIARDGRPGAEYRIGGELQRELSLPAEPRWIVARVASWSPKLPKDLESELDAEARGRPPLSANIAIVLVAVLMMIIAVGLVLQAR